MITPGLRKKQRQKKKVSLGKWNSSSSRFLCEVTRSEAGQDRWNNIIRSLREGEQGQIIRLNQAEWKCMGGKVLTPSSLSSNSQRFLCATIFMPHLSIYGPQTLTFIVFTASSITSLWWWANGEQNTVAVGEVVRETWGNNIEIWGQKRQLL